MKTERKKCRINRNNTKQEFQINIKGNNSKFNDFTKKTQQNSKVILKKINQKIQDADNKHPIASGICMTAFGGAALALLPHVLIVGTIVVSSLVVSHGLAKAKKEEERKDSDNTQQQSGNDSTDGIKNNIPVNNRFKKVVTSIIENRRSIYFIISPIFALIIKAIKPSTLLSNIQTTKVSASNSIPQL